jgi:hypothetical protein
VRQRADALRALGEDLEQRAARTQAEQHLACRRSRRPGRTAARACRRAIGRVSGKAAAQRWKVGLPTRRSRQAHQRSLQVSGMVSAIAGSASVRDEQAGAFRPQLPATAAGWLSPERMRLIQALGTSRSDSDCTRARSAAAPRQSGIERDGALEQVVEMRYGTRQTELACRARAVEVLVATGRLAQPDRVGRSRRGCRRPPDRPHRASHRGRARRRGRAPAACAPAAVAAANSAPVLARW